jgi:hypothetical protein
MHNLQSPEFSTVVEQNLLKEQYALPENLFGGVLKDHPEYLNTPPSKGVMLIEVDLDTGAVTVRKKS